MTHTLGARSAESRRWARTLVVLVLAVPVLLSGHGAGASQPAGAEANEPAAAAGARWIAEELARLVSGAGAGAGAGALADVILALAGVAAEPEARAAAFDALQAQAQDGSRAPGPVAKTLLSVSAHGGDPNAFGGRDLEAELRAAIVTADGEDRGSFAGDTTFNQALGILALARTPAGVPAEAVEWLLDQQCADGGFAPNACPAGTVADNDHTAIAAQALLASPSSPAADAARAAAVAALLDAQAPDGSYAAGGVANANSTGLAAQALRAVGEVAAADEAAAFVVSLQFGQDAEPALRGAIRFAAAEQGSLLLATTQGVLGLGAAPFGAIGGPPPPVVTGRGCPPGDGVTVVVDLTAFGAGVEKGCAQGAPASGLDALAGAGFAFEEHAEFAGFVCRIDGLPSTADACTTFGNEFWGYFNAEDGGDWTTSQVGAATHVPAPGTVEGWRFGTGAAPSVPPTSDPATAVERLAGTTRIATAVAISTDAFADGAATGAVLTRADDFADALAGTPLAARVGGPLLITGSDGLADEIAAELRRALPAGGTVHVLGGPAALAPTVDDQLEALGYRPLRVAGPDRFATAIAVADALGSPDQLLVTTGFAFADALAAGTAAAARSDAAVLLTTADAPHPAVDAYLAERPDAEVFAVGGPAARAYPGATPVFGATREGTAVAVAERFFTDPAVVGVARRDDFADALAGGAHAGQRGGPLLITPTGALAAELGAYLCATGSITAAFVYGGPVAVDAAVIDAVDARIDGSACP